MKVGLNEMEKYIKEVVPLIEDTNVTKVGVALTFHLACKLAKEDGIKVILSGLGSEEIFAGYKRHRDSTDINKECLSGLLKMYERDTYRDDVITMANNLELRVPFLDKELIELSTKIPGDLKIRDGVEKSILREAAIEMGLPKGIAMRKKKAAQYGSKTDRAIVKLAKRNGYRLKSEYLRTFLPYRNLKLGAMVSGGKDSIYAMHVMKKQNYGIACLIAMKSDNLDSYMFHTPGIEMVDLQAEALGIPLVVGKTQGKKEEELKDLIQVLKTAKKRYNVDGIITGALYSTYQRDRIEKVCGSLGLKIFSPLWHINQETEMREILHSGFKVILTAVAAEGLDKSWLNRPLTGKDVDKLVKLKDSIGLNVAGEGGEFESLVLDMPDFKKEIVFKKSQIVMDDERTGRVVVEDAGFKEKTL